MKAKTAKKTASRNAKKPSAKPKRARPKKQAAPKKKAQRICPACGETRVRRIVYGYAGPDLGAKADRGEIVLGGCCIIAGLSPAFSCECGHEFGIAFPAREPSPGPDDSRPKARWIPPPTASPEDVQPQAEIVPPSPRPEDSRPKAYRIPPRTPRADDSRPKAYRIPPRKTAKRPPK